MEVYADVLELVARALMNAILWGVAAVLVGATVVAVTDARWLPLIAAVASLVPVLAVTVTVRSHAATVRERYRRASYNAQYNAQH